jgi:Lon protease-like protein
MEARDTHDDETLGELRLFPLNVVLFPGMTLPLRIFEERYRLMIGECLDAQEPFGVALIHEGPEVGGPARPYPTGTTARITSVERLEDGRMNLVTMGEKRFRIVDTIHEVPYLKGHVRYLPEEIGDAKEPELTRARELFEEYLRGLAGLQGGWIRRARAPSDPGLLSYSVAQYLELPVKARQRLLEVPFTAERLHYEIPLLEGAVKRLREELVRRSPYKGPRLS